MGMATPTVHRDPDIEFQLDYLERTAGSGQANIYPRFQGLGNWLAVEITDAQLRLIEAVGWTQTVLDTNTSATTTNGQWYTLRIVADGADITVYRQTGDGVEEEVLSGTTGALASGAVAMTNFAGADHVYNDVRILADDLSDSYTYDYNGANELTSSTGPNGTTTYGYDDWGRMTSKSDGTRTATYDYRYDGMLYGVDSNFVGEGDVDYEYGGQRKRRERTVGGTTTQYNWDAGWNLLNEEDASGNLTRTFFHDPNKPIGTMLAHVDGTSPSTSDFLYYFQDNIGSTTQLRNEDNSFAGAYEYTPYGKSWYAGGISADHQFTGKYRDTKADLYYFPYRHYNPALARWTTPDPEGMIDGPNMYSYVSSNPIEHFDPLGLVRDCSKEQIICFRRCWNSNPPWPIEKGKRGHYLYCQSKCLAEYLECVAEGGLEKVGDFIDDLIPPPAPGPRDEIITTIVICGVIIIIIIPGPQPI